MALKIGEHTFCVEGCFAIDDGFNRLAEAWMGSLGIGMSPDDADALTKATAALKGQGDLKDAVLAAHPTDPLPPLPPA